SVGMATLNLGPVRDPLYIVIPITSLYFLIFFTGVVGNIITCVVIARNKHMQTATNYYLFSLAVSDLVLLLSGLPQEIYCIWSRYPYVFGEVFCVLRGLFAETSANATVLTITAFTMERYVAICHPFLSQTMSKLSRAVKIIIIIWIVAIVLAVPQAFQFGIVIGNTPDIVMCIVKSPIFAHSFEISTLVFFITPMILITVLYALIGVRLRHSNMIMKCAAVGSLNCKHDSHPLTTASLHRPRQRHPETGKHRKTACCRQHQIQCSRRVIKMLVAVVVAFFICWAPFHAQRLFAIYGMGKAPAPVILKIYEIMTYISGILYYVSTTINPILYHIMSLKFRQAFK
ncbi:Neuromedin-U receptor 2, partial [Zootermopsis nevadensis]